jgi:hypothetical protein
MPPINQQQQTPYEPFKEKAVENCTIRKRPKNPTMNKNHDP